MHPLLANKTARRLFDNQTTRALQMAMANDDYHRDRISPINRNLAGFRWLIASNRGLFAVDTTGYKRVMRGWFFGLCRNDDNLFIFENCGLWKRSEFLGRILRFDLRSGLLANGKVIVKELDNQCHQIRILNGLLCVVDTGNQRIRRFTLDGEHVDDPAPFPIAPLSDRSGAYRHINSIAKVGDRIGIMCHNGGSDIERKSAVAWLDENWRVIEETEIDGHNCHDIALDPDGSVWHSASKEGAILSGDGRRIEVADERMTRGLAVSESHIAIGLVILAPRDQRRSKGGEAVILDRSSGERVLVKLPSSPTDIVAL